MANNGANGTLAGAGGFLIGSGALPAIQGNLYGVVLVGIGAVLLLVRAYLRRDLIE